MKTCTVHSGRFCRFSTDELLAWSGEWTLQGCIFSDPARKFLMGLPSVRSVHAPGRAFSPPVNSSPSTRRELWSASVSLFQGPEPPAALRAGPRTPGRQHGPERGARPQAGLAAETQLPGAAGGPAPALQHLQVPETISLAAVARPRVTRLKSLPLRPPTACGVSRQLRARGQPRVGTLGSLRE